MLLLLVSYIPHAPTPVTDVFDVVELNHFYDGQGRLVFQQLIFWDFYAPLSTYICEGYVIARQPQMTPYRYGPSWCVIYRDNDSYRRIVGRRFRQTWTQYDPEVEARKLLPLEQRRNLSNVERSTPNVQR